MKGSPGWRAFFFIPLPMKSSGECGKKFLDACTSESSIDSSYPPDGEYLFFRKIEKGKGLMQVSIIGTGLMGKALAERLMDCGHEVVVYNRTRSKLESLQQRGAAVARSAAEAIQASSCSILMLADMQAIQEAVFGNGSPNFQKRTLIQMGTIAPSESIALGQEIRAGIGEYFEAPVLGSIAETNAGKLIVMVGGAPEQVDRWSEVLKCFCQEPLLIGPIGQGAGMKLALNQLIASHVTAFSLSLGFIQRSGVKVESFMEVLRQSALMAPMFDKKLPRMLEHDYDNPNFPTVHLLKDVSLCVKVAEEGNLEAASLRGIRMVLEKAVAQGLSDCDYSSVFEAIVPSDGHT